MRLPRRKKLHKAMAGAGSAPFNPLHLSPAAWYKAETLNQDRSSDYTGDYVFNAPLKTTLVLTDGTGDPTFTRATTATVVDFEGLIKTVKSGEARFTGARRVENLIRNDTDSVGGPSTIDLTRWGKENAGISVTNGQTDPNGGTDANLIVGVAGNGVYVTTQNPPYTGKTYRTSMWIKRVSGTGAVKIWNPDASQTTLTGVSTTWQRFCGDITAYNGRTYIGLTLATTGDSVLVAWPLLEEVSGQTVQAPSEYVSVGVLSAPYHGAGVDGVKYFDTENGNTVASNVVTEATGAAIANATLKGYLAEGSRENLALYSAPTDAQFAGSYALTEISYNDAAAVAPDGTTTAMAILETAANNQHNWRQAGITTTAAVHAFSAYFKPNGRDYVWLYDGATSTGKLFNIATGTVLGNVVGAPTSAGIESAGNGWYRCWITNTETAAANTFYFGTSSDGTTISYVGDITKGVYWWGMAVEPGSFPSSYIPTTTAAVTRNADVLTYQASGNISGAAGTCYAEVSTQWSTAPTNPVILWPATGSGLYANTGAASTVIYFSDGSANAIKTGLGATSSGTRKRAAAWGGSTMVVTGDGAAVASQSFDGNIGSTAIAIGCTDSGSLNWFGNIRNVRIWDYAVPKYVLKTLTGGTGPSSSDLTCSVWEDASGNGRPLEQVTSANQPISLPFSGTPYAYLPGVAGNYFSTPDSAALDITGDVTLDGYIAANDWTPTGDYRAIAGKYSVAGQRSYLFGYRSSGALFCTVSNDGTTELIKTSTAAPVVSDGSGLYVRVEIDVDNGAAGWDVRFYTSSDGVTYSQLGNTVTTATAIAIHSGSAALEVGAVESGTNLLSTFKAYRVKVWSGCVSAGGASLVADFNPSDFAETSTNGATAVSSTTGETWTLNSTGSKPAQIVKSASLLFDGTDDYLKTAAFTLNQPTTVYMVVRPISWTDNRRYFDGNTNNSGTFYQSVATPGTNVYAGNTMLGVNFAMGIKAIASIVLNGASSSITCNAGTPSTGNVGASNMGGITLGANGGNTEYINAQAYELIAFPAAHDAATRSQMISYLNRKYGIF